MKAQGTQYPVDYEGIEEHRKVIDYAVQNGLIGSEVQIQSRNGKVATVTLLGFLFDHGSLMGAVRFSLQPAMVQPVHYSRIVQLDPVWKE